MMKYLVPDYPSGRKSWSRSKSALMSGASVAAVMSVGLAANVSAQDSSADAEEFEEIVVTGIRQSLRASADIKRRSSGVVDGIVAEDMGKFPDSNLAESLQRITGVSINRQNNEGSQVTVRGFGPGFNHVTINGRSMPTADVPLVGGDGSGTSGATRAFDFSNIAPEAVSAIQIYKTGRADIASGGIGATINVETRKPLDQSAGFSGGLSAKALHDSSVDRGDDITPELAGFLSWSDDEEKFGIAIFGGYAKRDNGAASVNSAAWNIETAGTFLDPSNGRVTANTQITGAPSDPNALIAVPRDSRQNFSEFTRERINGQAVLQFNPTETLRLTADATYFSNEAEEQRGAYSNWFNRPFSQVAFDDNPLVATTVFLAEELTSPKDLAMEQTLRATKDELTSFGFNAEWDATDRVTISFDAHTSEAKVTPNAPMGYSAINVGMAMPVVVAHSVDYSGEVPLVNVVRDDSIASNGDGIFDARDISTQVANLRTVTQENQIDQFDLHADWDIDDEISFTAGANYRTQTNSTRNQTFRQILGNWGATNPGDVESLLPGALEEYCLSCLFDEFTISDAQAFRGNAADIFAAVSPFYDGQGNPLNTLSSTFDEIEEDVLSIYGQFDVDTELAGMGVRFSVGLRYEKTDVSSFTESVPTGAIIWQGDNDFNTIAGTSTGGITLESSYDNFLPNVDLAIDLTEDVVSRFSYSKTIARAGYSNLFASDSVNTPAGPSALGNVATGTQGNPGLLPLESDNFDVSFEWYYGPDSWVAVGGFVKRVRNFVGVGQVTGNLFGLRDATSGAAGTRSGDALALLNTIGADVSDRNLFAMTALIDREGSLAAAQAVFQANQTPSGALDDAFYIQLETDLDVTPNSDDPLYAFELTQPINNEEAEIRGLEMAFQHFFGETGIGIAGSYTLVDGDVGFDVGADPSTDQFALTGLSDTANITLIYENYGLSARVAYNWRDDFLASANRGGGFRNPVFVESFATFDVNISYNVTENFAVSFEGINLTGESSRTYGRDLSNLWFARENKPRFFLGGRYKF